MRSPWVIGLVFSGIIERGLRYEAPLCSAEALLGKGAAQLAGEAGEARYAEIPGSGIIRNLGFVGILPGILPHKR